MREARFLLLLPPASAVAAGCAYGARHPIADLIKLDVYERAGT